MPTALQEARQKVRSNKAQPTRYQAGRWAFDTAYGDHFKSSVEALGHMVPMLQAVACSLYKSPEPEALRSVQIYDPYYCDGSVRKHLSTFGFKSVHNENRDFYADVAGGSVPAHDVLLTNPPYSEDHKEKLFSFLLRGRDKPFCLLMPAWVAKRAYWRQLLWVRHKRRTSGRKYSRLEDAEGKEVSDEAEKAARCFYFSPSQRYQFSHVDGQQASSKSPFVSMWFVGGMKPKLAARVRRALTALGQGHVYRTLTELCEAGVIESKAAARKKAKARYKGAMWAKKQEAHQPPDKKRRKS